MFGGTKIRANGKLVVSGFLGLDLVLVPLKIYNSIKGKKPVLASPAIIDTFRTYENPQYAATKGKFRMKNTFNVPKGHALVMLKSLV